MPTPPTTRPPAGAELAYQQIRAAIVEGRYESGQRLVESNIAEEFGISRTPVREAIRRLDAEGLVVTERDRGAAVRRLTRDDVHDLYELRARLESYAAELAAQRISDAELAELRRCVDRYSELVAHPVQSVDDLRRVSDANSEIHRWIVIGSHHDRVGAMLARTVDVPLVFRAFQAFGPAELHASDLFHRLLLVAIEAGQPQRASRLMREHISQGLDAVERSMRRTGDVDSAAVQSLRAALVPGAGSATNC